VSNDTSRPPPEHFLSMIRQQQRGLLKVYLGFAAGVGKTYEMLQEAHRLKRNGVDVVIGMVETHGRLETAALVEGLEQVPRRQVEYHGVTLEEMDLDAVLARRPTVALVDELAHTNAPGSKFAKRYQDVEELLRAGINVISTLNIQHLESLYDLIEKSTGVKVKERIPDYVLGMANQIVNVDLSAEDLRERLEAGKVYPAERAKLALDHFFTPDNLSRLRELALSEIAHLLDRRRREQAVDDKPDSKDRVLVCVSSRSPNPTALLRKAARMADRLDAQWFAVYIQTPREALERVDASLERQVNNALALAHQLGATRNPRIQSDDVVGTIAAFVKEYSITYVLLGRTQRPWYRRWFGRSVLDQLLRRVENVDVVVVHGV
jgi:two-component system, OmpR family, sensor histidine kinase KdpD